MQIRLINLQNTIFSRLFVLLKSLASADEQYFYHVFGSLFQRCVPSQIKMCKQGVNQIPLCLQMAYFRHSLLWHQILPWQTKSTLIMTLSSPFLELNYPKVISINSCAASLLFRRIKLSSSLARERKFILPYHTISPSMMTKCSCI